MKKVVAIALLGSFSCVGSYAKDRITNADMEQLNKFILSPQAAEERTELLGRPDIRAHDKERKEATDAYIVLTSLQRTRDKLSRNSNELLESLKSAAEQDEALSNVRIDQVLPKSLREADVIERAKKLKPQVDKFNAEHEKAKKDYAKNVADAAKIKGAETLPLDWANLQLQMLDISAKGTFQSAESYINEKCKKNKNFVADVSDQLQGTALHARVYKAWQTAGEICDFYSTAFKSQNDIQALVNRAQISLAMTQKLSSVSDALRAVKDTYSKSGLERQADALKEYESLKKAISETTQKLSTELKQHKAAAVQLSSDDVKQKNCPSLITAAESLAEQISKSGYTLGDINPGKRLYQSVDAFKSACQENPLTSSFAKSLKDLDDSIAVAAVFVAAVKKAKDAELQKWNDSIDVYETLKFAPLREYKKNYPEQNNPTSPETSSPGSNTEKPDESSGITF